MKARRLLMIFAVMFVAACAKEPFVEPEIEQGGSEYAKHEDGVWFNFSNVTSGDEQTRALKESESGLDFSWLDGDCISVWSAEGAEMKATLVPSEQSASATFNGSGFSLTDGKTYYSFFPSVESNQNSTVDKCAVPFDFSSQTLSGSVDGYIKNFKTHDFNWASAVCENGTADFNFKHIPAFVKMELTLPNGVTAIDEVTVGASENVFVINGTIDVTKGTITSKDKMSNKITLSADSENPVKLDGQKLVVWFALAPVDLSNRTIYIIAKSDKDRYSVSFTAGSFKLEAGKFYSSLFKRSLVKNDGGNLSEALTKGGTVFASSCENDLETNKPVELATSVNLVVDRDLTIPAGSIVVGNQVVFSIIGDDKTVAESVMTKAGGSEAVLTIEDGGIVNEAGAVSIDGATIKVNASGDNGCAIRNNRIVTVLRGDVNSEKSNIVLNVGGKTYNKKVTIEGGTVSAKIDVVRNEANTVSAATINGGTVSAGRAVIYNMSNEAGNSVEVFGGEVVLKEEAKVVDNAAGITNTLKAEAFGGQFQKNGQVLKTIDDIVAAGIDVPEGYNVDDDGNIVPPDEVEVVAKIGEKKFISLAEAVEYVKNNETITVVASEITGTQVPAGSKTFTIDLGGKEVTVKGPAVGSTGTVNQAFQLLKGNTITIKNGGLKVSDGSKFRFIIQNYCNLTLDGVTVDGTGLSYNTDSKGYTYALSNNSGSVELKGATTIKASTESGLKNYAFDACYDKNYDKPTVTWNSTGSVSGKIELSGGDLTLSKNLTVTTPMVVTGASTLNLGSAALNANFNDSSENQYATVIVSRGGNLTIEGSGTINSGKAYGAVQMVNPNDIGDSVAKLTVNGCTIEGKYYGIVGNGNRGGTEIAINGGTVRGLEVNDNAGIYHPQDGTLTINGGTIEGATGVWIKAGSVSVVSGGNIIGNGMAKEYVTSGDGFIATGDAFVIDNCDYPGGVPSAKISGGRFSSANAKPVASYARTGQTAVSGFVSGGLFNKPLDAAVVASGYAVVPNDDPNTKTEYPCTVKESQGVCKIGDTSYATLADAVAAVPASGAETTITMIADEAIEGNAGVTVAASQNIILDLAGHTVKNLVNEDKASQVITNKGTLTVKNGVIKNDVKEGTKPGEWWSTPQANYTTNVILNTGTLIVDGAEIWETAAGSICYAIDNNSSAADAICTIKSGYVHNGNRTAVRMFCNSTKKENVVNLEGGTVEGEYAGIWTQLPGSAGEAKKGTLNITGGSLKGEYAWYDYSFGDVFDAMTYSISGGQISGWIYSEGLSKGLKGFVTGGLFSYCSYTDPYDGTVNKLSDYVAPGYAVVDNTDSKTKEQYPYTVEKAPGVGATTPSLGDWN